MNERLNLINRRLDQLTEDIQERGQLIKAAEDAGNLQLARKFKQEQHRAAETKARLLEERGRVERHAARKDRFPDEGMYPTEPPDTGFEEEHEYEGDPLSARGAYSDGNEGIVTLGEIVGA